MIELYNLGISESTIKDMIEMQPNIKELTEKEIKEKITILKELNCSDNQIVNIIGSNPHYLDRTNKEIMKLIETLIKYGFTTFNLRFESNPYM